MSNGSKVMILPYRQLGGLLGQSEGHGVFIDCGFRMNVGAILPQADGKYRLNVMIMPELQIPGYKPCDISEVYDSYDDAVQATHAFLKLQQCDGS